MFGCRLRRITAERSVVSPSSRPAWALWASGSVAAVVVGEARVVFVSYAHEDVEVWRRLEVLLKPLLRKGRLELWADTRIGVARRWEPEIERHLLRAELAVLLVSGDSLASDYVMEVELPRLLERGVPLVCVPVGPSGWRDVDELAALQWALPPERTLAVMAKEEQDGALMSVYEALAKLAAELDAAWLDAAAPLTEAPAAAPLTASARIAALVDVPALPTAYLPRRGDLDALRARVAVTAGVGVVGRRQRTGLHGRGGIGKSVLAAALCFDPEVRSWFPDGIFWATLGEDADLVAAQRALVMRLGGDAAFSTVLEGHRQLSELLAARACLVVVDDVWSTAGAEAFAAPGPAGRVLYTTRDDTLLGGVTADTQLVDVLDDASSLAFLEAAVGAVPADQRGDVDMVIAHSGGVLLALSLAAGVVRGGRSWAAAARRLERLAEVYRDHPYADVFKTMRLAVDHLAPADADRYRMLAVFGEDVTVPVATIGRLWGLVDATATLEVFADAGLVSLEAGRARLHDLQRAFLLFDLGQPLALVHHQLLDAHRPARGWESLPDDEPYLWDHLLYHLEMAGEPHTMAAVATNGCWLARRLHRDGAHAAEADVARAATARPDDVNLASVLAMLRRWSHLFKTGLSVAGTAATLISRSPPAAAAATPLLGQSWLEPVWPLPEPSALVRTLTGHTGRSWRWRSPRTARPGHRQLRRHGAVVGPGHRPTVTATLTGHTGGVSTVAFAPDGAQPGHRQRRRDGAVVGPGRPAAATWAPSPATPARCPRWRSPRTGAPWPPPATTGRCGCGTRPPATGRGHPHRPHRRGVVRWRSPRTGTPWPPPATTDGAVVGPGRPASRDGGTLTGHTGAVSAVAFAPDGAHLATAGDDGTVRLWDPATGTGRASRSPATPTRCGRWRSPRTGTRLATASDDRTVRLWDPADRPARDWAPLTGHTDAVWSVAFAPDGRTLATASDDGTVRLWDPADRPARDRRPLTGHTGGVRAVAFAPDGRTLATASDDGTVRLWDAADRRAATGHRSPATPARCLRWRSPRTGARLATASNDETVRLWDPADRPAVRRPLTGHTGVVSAVAFAPDGAPWPPPATTARCGCGTPTSGAGRRPSPATPACVRRWRSPRTAHPGHRQRRRHGAVVGPGRPGARDGAPLTGHTGAVSRWRSPRTAHAWPPPATTARCGCGTRRAGRRDGHPHRPHRRRVVGGVRPGRPHPGHRRRRRHGAVVGPGERCGGRGPRRWGQREGRRLGRRGQLVWPSRSGPR